MKVLLTLIIVFITLDVQAKDFGVEGTTFSIQEQNLLEFIMQKLTKMNENGEITKINEEFKQKARESIMRPKPVLGLGNATEDREFLYDPSITISEAILTHDKQTVHPAGTAINPLDKVRFHYTYLFIDGDNADQVQWALSHPAKSKKIILTSGAIIDLMREHEQRFYFDQGGKLTSKFGIQYLPAQVSQFGKRLKIKEVAL